jgi:hypothetical protein
MRQLNLERVLITLLLLTFAQAQESYLSDQASNPETTDGVARLLHYSPEDFPVAVFIPETSDGKHETVQRAFESWQEAVPELISFKFLESPSDSVLLVTWQVLELGKIGSYQYSYSVDTDGQYRFRTTDIFLDASLDNETLYRYALVQVGHALGLLGRSSFEGDAMSQAPSGIISERDKATLRALYAVPSGTPLF